jgi:hypothetical protein
MFIFITGQELWVTRANESHYGLRPLSLGWNGILKFVYCFMIIFLIYIFKHFLLLVPCNHQRSAIMLSFKIWLFFAWIRINMWIQVNIIYFKISQHHVGLSTSNRGCYTPIYFHVCSCSWNKQCHNSVPTLWSMTIHTAICIHDFQKKKMCIPDYTNYQAPMEYSCSTCLPLMNWAMESINKVN